jgi:hypothetical protein
MFATISYNKGDLGDDVWVMPASTHYFGERRQVRLACMECRAKKVHLNIHYRRKSSMLTSTGQVHWRKDWLRQMQHQPNKMCIPAAD